MVPQGFLGIPQEGKGIPFLGVSEKREGGKGTQSLGRERTLTFIFTKGAPDHHPPMPPTKAMGAIKQNRRGRPTTTPCSTFWCLNMVGFLRAIERRLRSIGYIFRTKFGWRGDLIPWHNQDGRAELVRLSRSKKSTIPQSTDGCLVGRQIGRVTERRLCLWRRKLGGIFDAWWGGKE